MKLKHFNNELKTRLRQLLGSHVIMDKLKSTWPTLGRVFNSRSGCMHAMQLIFTIAYRLTTYRFAPDRYSLPHKYTIRLAIFWRAFENNLTTDKLQLTRRNQCQVFNSRSGCTHAIHLWCEVKPPNLELKPWPKQLSGYLPKLLCFLPRTNFS